MSKTKQIESIPSVEEVQSEEAKGLLGVLPTVDDNGKVIHDKPRALQAGDMAAKTLDNADATLGQTKRDVIINLCREWSNTAYFDDVLEGFAEYYVTLGANSDTVKSRKNELNTVHKYVSLTLISNKNLDYLATWSNGYNAMIKFCREGIKSIKPKSETEEGKTAKTNSRPLSDTQKQDMQDKVQRLSVDESIRLSNEVTNHIRDLDIEGSKTLQLIDNIAFQLSERKDVEGFITETALHILKVTSEALARLHQVKEQTKQLVENAVNVPTAMLEVEESEEVNA